MEVATTQIADLTEPQPDETRDTAPVAATAFMSIATANSLADTSPAPTSASDPLGDLLAAIFLGFQRTFFNQTPTANPTQNPGQSSLGVVTGTVGPSDPDGDPLTVTLAQGPSKGGVTVNPDGTYTYTPSAALAATGGTDSFTVTITETNAANHIHGLDGLINAFLHAITFGAIPLNDGSTITKTITVSVAAINPNSGAPVAGIPAYSYTTDPITGIVTGHLNVTDPDFDVLTYTLSAPPSSGLGTATVDSATGDFSFTPTLQALLTAWADASGVSAVPFTVTASDGEHAASVAVSVSLEASIDLLVAKLERNGSTPSAVAVVADGTVYVTNSGANTLSIITPTNTTVVTVGHTPRAVTVGSDGRVWVVNSGDNTVTVTNPSGGILRTIAVGQGPSAISLGSDGAAFVANSGNGTVTVIDPASYGVVRTIAVGAAPTGIATGPDGRIFTANYGDGSVTVIDPSDDYATDTLTLDQINPYGITITPDGTIAVTDPLRNTVTLLTSIAKPLSGVIELAAPSGANRSVSSPQISGYQTTSVAVGSMPTAITSHEQTLYLINSGANTITSVNSLNYETAAFAVGDRPNGVFADANGVIYITNGGSNSVTVMNTQAASSATIDAGVDTFTVVPGLNGQLISISHIDGSIHVFGGVASATSIYAGDPLPTADSTISRWPGIAVDRNGYIYVATAGYWALGVNVYNPKGQLLATGGFSIPFGSGGGDIVISQTDNSERLYVQTNDGNVHVADISGVDDDFLPTPLIFTTIYSNGANAPIIGPAARAVTIDSRGWLYIATVGGLDSSHILVLDPEHDYSVLAVVSNFSASVYDRTIMSTGADGRIYLTNRSSSIMTVVDPLNDFATSAVTVSMGTVGVAVADNGMIFLADDPVYRGEAWWSSAITVLNADFTLAASVPIGVPPGDIAVGGDGRIYVGSSTHGVFIIDPTGLSIGSTFIPGIESMPASGARMVSDVTPGGGIYLLVDISDASGSSVLRPMKVVAIPVDDVISEDSAPASLRGLWNVAYTKATDNGTGLFMQTVRGEDGKNRLIVYIGGTTTHVFFEGDQAPAENVSAVAGVLKPDQVEAIKSEMDSWAQYGQPIAEIMLVGYSQGGIDAQNLAAPNPLNLFGWDPALVSTVITFGSPITKLPSSGDAVLHVQDLLDTVPKSVFTIPVASVSFESLAGLARWPYDVVYDGTSGVWHADDPLFGTHGDIATYRMLSDKVTYTTPGQHTSVKEALIRFQGVLVNPGPEF